MSTATVPQAFVHWEETLPELLDRTARFPKSARFTFTQRIENLGLDIIEDLVEARYAPRANRRPILVRLDGRLARLRVLLRLASKRRLLDTKGYTLLSRRVDDLGKMVGGWKRSLES